MDFSGKRILVFGTGISGLSAADLLLEKGAEVVLFDGNRSLDPCRIRSHFAGKKEIELYLGDLPGEIAADLSLVVLSPGVPADLPLVEALRESGIPIWGEIELAYRCSAGSLLAITGTNGKTTTTTLLGEILSGCLPDVRVAGNIGIPYTGILSDMTNETVTVAEISSFQLETVVEFHPQITAVLNITPDHLNRHHTMENYIAAKLSIAKNQTAKDICVLNYEDEILKERADSIPARIVWFSSLSILSEGLYLDGDKIIYAHDGQREEVIVVGDLNILGRHNYENVMAAAAMALSFGVSMEDLRKALRAFRAVEHRIEYVTEKRGVRFYNDSKGTNPDAAIKVIQAMDRPTCLIGGGYDKDSSYKEWIECFGGKVKKLVLIGQTREKIAAEAEACGFHDYVFADSLQEAVDICYENAETGDAVLLSPACASWGMFPNYEVRGKMFKEIVHALSE